MPKDAGRIRDPERRERILAAAADLIARRGYMSVSLSDIGAAAGIVGSGIYRHFDGKNAILVELFDRVVDRLVADAEDLLRTVDEPQSALASLVRGQVEFTLSERALCEVYLQEARNLPQKDLRRLKWKQRHYVDLWLELLRAVLPELSAGEAQVRVHGAISTVHSVLRYHARLEGAELASELERAAYRALDLPTVLSGAPAGNGGATVRVADEPDAAAG